MNAAALIDRLIAYGADEEGIRDRFGNNAELYEVCFQDFLTEPNFQILRTSVEREDYLRAFDAAHALKGLSGNLGVTPFYEAICTLVESLRAKNHAHLAEEYAAVLREYDRLLHITEEHPATPEILKPEQTAETGGNGAAQDADNVEKREGIRLRWVIVALVVALVGIAYAFGRISFDYRDNVTMESGRHLVEMSNQIQLYVQEQVIKDWHIAKSIGDSICYNDFKNDADVRDMMQRKLGIWDISNIMLYTDTGYCIYADGSTEMNDIASEMIVRARNRGRYLSVLDSNIIYTIPVETDRQYNGARIVAVSVVQNMETFLDEMRFSSFDNTAWLYLTDENGVVISRLSNPAAVSAFNFRAVIQDGEIEPLEQGTVAEDLFTARKAAAFMVSGKDGRKYVVSAPVNTGDAPLNIFYLAPEDVVNGVMNAFSQQLTVFSLLMVFLFGLLAFALFLLLYRSRKQRFNKAILARERMFDLLVQNTRTAFTLFTANRPEPVYNSSNSETVIGDKFWTIDRVGTGYRMRNSENTETEALRQANEMLAGWDGKHVFKSGYIKNDAAASPYWFEFQLYPIEGGDGVDFVGIAQDVTQAHEREEATKNAMEMAMRANEAKSRFLSNMSHDIRTPMNAIMNMTSFAQENIDQPKKLGPYLRTIRESAEHLLHLINEVLDMSRIESGQTVVASAPFDLMAAMRRQADMIRPLCIDKGQTLITNFNGLRTKMVHGDALKVSQIIMNLLSNAVKFTPENGAVRFSVAEIPSLSDELVDVRFVIEDNGIGVSSEDIERIFEPFCRADDNRVSKIEGTGLGLSICKSYIEAMGGTIKCESEQGEGSTFTVELFFRKAENVADRTAVNAVPGEAPFLGRHCLVVEDNATNRLIAKALLVRLGFIVDFAEDGKAGLLAFLSAKPGTFDVIYMDIRMPVMDGYEATVAIRTSGHPEAQTIPIVAMTANVFAEDMEKARVAGMDAYLGKPIVTFELVEQTNRAIQKKRG